MLEAFLSLRVSHAFGRVENPAQGLPNKAHEEKLKKETKHLELNGQLVTSRTQCSSEQAVQHEPQRIIKS